MKSKNYGLKSFLILQVIFIIFMTLAILSGCLCAAIIVYLKNGSFIFSWHDDVLFSIKRGGGLGMSTGAGIWILSKFKESNG